MAVTLGLLVVGCASAQAPIAVGTDEPTSEESIEPTPAPEPTQEPDQSVLTDAWTTSDGYGYSVALDKITGNATKDVLDARPGMANIYWSYSIAGTINNTTAGRNAPTPELFLQAVWPANSVMCTTQSEGFIRQGISSPTEGARDADGWCTLNQVPFGLLGSQDASGRTLDIPVGSISTLTGGGTNETTYALEVPEEVADALVDEVTNQVIWAFGSPGNPAETSVCGFDNVSASVSKTTGDIGCGV